MKKIIIATIVICLCTTSAFAAPVTITDPRMFRAVRSPNSLGFFEGDSILVVADCDPYIGTQVWGRDESGDLKDFIGQDFIQFFPQIFLGQFGRTFNYDSSLTDRWELWACNNEDCENSIYSGPAFTNDIVGIGQLPYVTDVAYYFASQDNTPTISWQVPSSSFGDRIRITVITKELPRRAVYESPPIPLQTTHHRIPDGTLNNDEGYAIRVKLEATDDDTITGNLISRSESFFDYYHQPIVWPLPIYLPMVGVDPDPNDEYGAEFKFDFEVVNGEPCLIDPLVAIGYDYKTGGEDPSFSSVTLPVMGDNEYELWLHNGSQFVYEDLITGGVTYNFVDPVDSFRILGIEVYLGIDPSNTTAFVTELTFAGDGRFTGTMTPIIISVLDCEGDFDTDGDVDGSDLSIFAADFGRTDCSSDCEGDFDSDGDVDGSDLATFAADFGRTDCPQVMSESK